MKGHAMRIRALTLTMMVVVASCFSLSRAGAVTLQATKRAVFLEIALPTQGAPPVRVAIREGEMATVEVADVGKFGFEPSLQKNQAAAVVVSIFDIAANPRRRLGDVQTMPGTKEVQSKTTPSFGIRVLRVTEPK
jgi:hypothetical protein